MRIILYTNNSPENQLTKDTTEITGFTTAVLKESTDILNPVFRIAGATWAEVNACNYIICPELGRGYFVRDITSVRDGVFEFACHVDVLSSFADSIRQQTAVIHRQENQWNLYLDDGIFKTYQNPHIVVKKFPSGFTTQSFVLAVAGD